MNKDWEERLLEASKRSCEDEEKEFLRLVDMATDNCSLDTVRSLMKTFSSQPDYGTQERVESVLATAKAEDVARAILEDLPRLMNEAPEWAESLIGIEIDNRLDLFSSTAAEMPANIKDCLRRLISSDDFLDFYPVAKKLIIK